MTLDRDPFQEQLGRLPPQPRALEAGLDLAQECRVTNVHNPLFNVVLVFRVTCIKLVS